MHRRTVLLSPRKVDLTQVVGASFARTTIFRPFTGSIFDNRLELIRATLIVVVPFTHPTGNLNTALLMNPKTRIIPRVEKKTNLPTPTGYCMNSRRAQRI